MKHVYIAMDHYQIIVLNVIINYIYLQIMNVKVIVNMDISEKVHNVWNVILLVHPVLGQMKINVDIVPVQKFVIKVIVSNPAQIKAINIIQLVSLVNLHVKHVLI